LNEKKGITYLIKAVPYILKAFPEVKFFIVGETPKEDRKNFDFKDKMIKLCAQLGLNNNVIFTGFRDDIPDILEKIDVFVLPSLLEACSLAVLEAMAQEKAMVVTDVGGIPELVNTDIAYIVKPADEIGLAKAIIELLKDREKRTRMGQECRKRLEEKFDLKLIINKLEETQLELLKKKEIN
jgi:glycosyltransferase involved in cell wall biosynthesis